MNFKKNCLLLIVCVFLFSGCIKKGENPIDPYEASNRKIHQFNMAFDATFLKPLAKIYVWILPEPSRVCINNAYNNINMIPTTANDLLQGQLKMLPKDFWRFVLNSTVGVGGLFDVADKHFGLKPHSNDLGLTFAKWGDKNSPYIVIPLLGPATIRDGMGALFEYTFLTPYPYIPNDVALYTLLGVRYVDLRSQLFDAEKLMDESLDKYTFIRDVYMQRRAYQLADEGSKGTPFIVDGSDYVEE
jgi:phospholipid-binding lipoprotein MlaA